MRFVTCLAITFLLGAAEPSAAQSVVDTLAMDGPGVDILAAGTSATGSCLEYRPEAPSNLPVDLDGRRFWAKGQPEPISADNLLLVGRDGDVAIYVGRFATEPYADLWLPVCAPAGRYQLYTVMVTAEATE